LPKLDERSDFSSGVKGVGPEVALAGAGSVMSWTLDPRRRRGTWVSPNTGSAALRAHGNEHPYDDYVDSSSDEMSVRRILLGFPGGSSVQRVEFSDDGNTLTLWTQDFGPLLGKRGLIADRIRTAIEDEFQRSVQLNFGELQRPDT
jgi:predicted RNA-binding protein YlqC (UPF0109 family)